MRLSKLLVICSSFLLLSACGNKSDDVSSETDTPTAVEVEMSATPDNKVAAMMMTKMGDLADALEMVKDEDSARKAAEEIAKIGVELEALANKADSASSSGKMSIMMKANSNEFMAIQTRLGSNMARIAMTDPQLLQIIGNEMDKLDLE